MKFFSTIICCIYYSLLDGWENCMNLTFHTMSSFAPIMKNVSCHVHCSMSQSERKSNFAGATIYFQSFIRRKMFIYERKSRYTIRDDIGSQLLCSVIKLFYISCQVQVQYAIMSSSFLKKSNIYWNNLYPARVRLQFVGFDVCSIYSTFRISCI